MHLSKFIHACLTLLVLGAVASFSDETSAQTADAWPTKPVRFIVPYVAGGASDITVRSIAQLLTTSLGQTMMVENKAGGGGNIGTDFVAKAAPDGYTFLMAYAGPIAINPHLYKNIAFNAQKDFAPVSLMADAPLILAVHPSVPANNLAELIAYLKANPDQAFFGSSGTGGADHLAGELFRLQAGVRINHIPFKGGAQAVVDLVAGRTQLEFLTIPGGLSHIRAGRLKAIALASSKRFPLFPDVPTMTEAGMKDFEINNWYGLSAPAGTPAPIIERMNRALQQAIQDPALRLRFQEVGLVPMSNTPDEFSALIKSDSEKWQKIIQASGVTAE
ncbi:MAG: tripartite tricarboxylate transporter substrate binding protein [Alcaligenaceae bacterium]